MAWEETTDAAELWRRAGTWLGEHPVENAPLLAEVAHLLAAGAAPAGLACGWWSEDDGAVRGAYVGLPRHTPLLTRMPRAALDELPSRLGPAGGVGVPAAIVDDIVEAWAAAGTRLVPGRVFTVHVLDGTPGPPAAVGHWSWAWAPSAGRPALCSPGPASRSGAWVARVAPTTCRQRAG